MNPTRRQFVQTLFVAGQATLLGRIAGAVPSFTGGGSPPAVHFLVFGDWGVNGELGQAQVAAQMARVATARGASFMVAVGDNFYPVGVASAQDPQWRTSFEAVYADPSLQIPCHAILGNHDYCGNCDAQIEYGKTHPRWIMPARYFTRTHRVDARSSAEFFFIDTCPFVAEYRTGPKPMAHPGAQDHPSLDPLTRLQANVLTQDAEAQLRWLDDALGKSRAQWKIVVGHHPIYSGGLHGDQPELIAGVLPLLHKHGVQVYLCGHDHDLQHLQSQGVDFLCSGAGGAKLYPLHHTEQTKFAESQFGFMALALDRSTLNADLIDQQGRVVYQTSIRLRSA